MFRFVMLGLTAAPALCARYPTMDFSVKHEKLGSNPSITVSSSLPWHATNPFSIPPLLQGIRGSCAVESDITDDVRVGANVGTLCTFGVFEKPSTINNRNLLVIAIKGLEKEMIG